MATLQEATGAPTAITLDGTRYVLCPLTFGDLGTLQQEAGTDLLLSAFQAIESMPRLLPERETLILDRAYAALKGIDVSDAFGSAKGCIGALWLSLRKE